MKDAQHGILSMVGTPIGNLDDASPRVVETLSSADVILCEDTRVTSKLLNRFSVHVPLERCDENVIARRIPSVIERIEAGQRVAFVSDAGMPCISDPGWRLVDAAIDRGVRVEVIPGPSALTCALVASGMPCDHIFFEGFLPRKTGERISRLGVLARIPATLVAYESPHRVCATLDAIAEVMPGRTVALVRELTKLHEEVVRAKATELADIVRERGQVRGECVIVIGAPTEDESMGPEDEPQAAAEDVIREGLSAGEPKSALAKRVAKAYGIPRSEAYDLVMELSGQID